MAANTEDWMSATAGRAFKAGAIDIAGAVATLASDGVTGLKGAFSRDWVERMREDIKTVFWAAIQRPGGKVGRSPRR